MFESKKQRPPLAVFIFACILFMTSWSRVMGVITTYDLKANTTVEEVIHDQPAAFGDDFPDNGLEGFLMVADPPTACQELKSKKPEEPAGYNWILLIARGGPDGCQFSDKVLRAQKAGFQAAIIHDNRKESAMPQMSGANGSMVSIPSTFVRLEDGIILAKRNYTTRRYIIQIKESNVNIKMFLWPFVIVLGVCLIISVGFLLVKVAIDANRRQRSRLSSRHLKKIPIKKYKKGDYYDTCAICLEEYEDKEKIRVLPCDHVYHAKCIDPWLTKNKKTCPVCKRRVIPRRAQDSSDSESDAEARERTPLLRGAAGGQQRGVSINNTVAELQQEGATASGSNDVTVVTDLPSSFLPQEAFNERQKRRKHRVSGQRRLSPQNDSLVAGSEALDHENGAMVAAVTQELRKEETREERKERKRKKKAAKKKRRAVEAVPDDRQRMEHSLREEEDEEFLSAHSSFRDDDRREKRQQLRKERNEKSIAAVDGCKDEQSKRKEERKCDGDKEVEGAEGYDNLSFSNTEEVVLSSGHGSGSKKRELNEVV